MIKRKFEGIDGIYPDVEEFYDTYCDEDCFTDAQSIADATEECIEYLVSECGYDEDVVDSDAWYNKIKRYLVRLASGNESCKKESKLRKLEGMSAQDIWDAASVWFNENVDMSQETLQALVNYSDTASVEQCCADMGVPNNRRAHNYVANCLASFAEDALANEKFNRKFNYGNKKLEARIRRLEKLIRN